MPRKRFEFICDSGGWGVASELAALVTLVFSIYEHARNAAVPAYGLVITSVLLFWLGAYFAWSKKYTELGAEVSKRGRPEITVEFQKIDNPPRTMLYLRNHSDSPAVNVSVREIRQGSKVLQFFVPRPIAKGPGTWADCWILENGRKDHNDVMALFRGIDFIGQMGPHFDLTVYFTNQDSAASRRTWVVKAVCLYDKYSDVISVMEQKVEPA